MLVFSLFYFVLFLVMLTVLFDWIGLGCAVNGVLGGIDTDEYEWSRQPATNHHLILG
jgi:hypothetical protein